MELTDHAARFPDKPAYIMAASGEVVTYRELEDRSNRLAQMLHARGLRPGDHIAVMLDNHARYLEITWAAQRSGLYYTTISSLLTASEVSFIVGDSQARAFFTSISYVEIATHVAREHPSVGVRVMVDGSAAGYEDYAAAVAPYPTARLETEVEGSDMLYSSGTTGRPKGIKAPPTGLTAGSPALVNLFSTLWDFDADAIYLSTAPLYHSAPLRSCMSVHRMGGSCVVMEEFDALRALECIERYGITHSQWVATMFVRLLRLPEPDRARFDLSSQRVALHSAAPTPVSVKQQMMAWWGPILYEYYGGTEGNGFAHIRPEEWLQHPGSVGRATVGVPHIVDDDGNELPPGEVGTLWFSDGPRFEYHNDPQKTADAYDARGWSTIGDVGYIDADGYLYLTDRRADMIISGGVNIYPREAENVLITHPKVVDVAVFGVPDLEFGEQVKAVVQPLSMGEAGRDLESQLIAYCRGQLAAYKCPRSVDFHAALPRHPSGKLYKRLLKDQYWAAGVHRP